MAAAPNPHRQGNASTRVSLYGNRIPPLVGDVLLSEAPLCKGSCREATEGLSRKHHCSTEIPSESCQSLRPAGTSLYTREAWSEYNLAYSPGPGCNGNLTPPGSRGRLPLRVGRGRRERIYPFRNSGCGIAQCMTAFPTNTNCRPGGAAIIVIAW